MTDNKSSENRRKLLKSIAAGSGAIIAGKSLPENWTKPAVDSVLLPAHAQTSACTTINVHLAFNLTGDIDDSNWDYEITPLNDGDSGTVEDFANRTDSYTVGPGQYIVDGSMFVDLGDGGLFTGEMSVSCCNGTPVPFASLDLTGPDDGGSGGCVIVTIGADGTCNIDSNCET